MVRHFIIMSSSYTEGVRVALDITQASLLNSETINAMLQEIRSRCGDDVPLSTHFLETQSDSWPSVAAYDPFFEDVVCVKTVSEFSDKVKESRVLTGLDVACYILSKIKCTHLSLEKLVYFSYADYLCRYSKRLFRDKIYAFTHGPVVESVFETYKRSGYQYVEPIKFDQDSAVHTTVKELPARSRILFARDGMEKLRSIDRTIERYGNYTARALVSLTHRPGSPWSHVDSKKPYQTISDELILNYHQIECSEHSPG